MARYRPTLALLILASAIAWTCSTSAEPLATGPNMVAQALTPPAPPAEPTTATPLPPAAPTPPITPTAAQDTGPGTSPGTAQPIAPDAAIAIGGVATLQGSATVTRNSAQNALKLNDAIYKGDVLQTSIDSTLGITFDDDTTFTMSANSRFSVDEFVYAAGGAHNAALFTVFLGKVAFVADKVAHTGNMTIATPTATLGIRGTTGIIEVPAGATPGTTGEVAIKLYPDVTGRVGRIEVFGRDGAQLGVLTRGATGFSIQSGVGGRFTAVQLRITPQEVTSDRAFVRRTFSTLSIGHRNNLERHNLLERNLRTLQPSGQPRQNLERLPLQPKLQQTPGTLPKATLPRGTLQVLPKPKVTVPKLEIERIR